MNKGAEEQDLAVKSGYWPQFHCNLLKPKGQRLIIDSKDPTMELADFMYHENRFKVIKAKDPVLAERFMARERLNTLK